MAIYEEGYKNYRYSLFCITSKIVMEFKKITLVEFEYD